MILAAVKVLLIILLILLSAAVLILAVFLFAPIKYRVKGSFKGKPDLSFRLGWLFGSVRLKGSYTENGSETSLNYPFKKLKERFDKIKKQNNKRKKKKPSPKSQTQQAPSEQIREQKPRPASKNVGAKKPNKPKQKKKSAFSKLINNIKTIGSLRNKGDIISCLVKNIIYLLKKQKFSVFGVNIIFGFDDPSLTGKVLGLLYASTLALIKGVEIKPDFEKASFEAEIDIKGRGNLFYIAVTAVKILLNKNVRDLIF